MEIFMEKSYRKTKKLVDVQFFCKSRNYLCQGKKTKQNYGEVYFLCSVVWMYLLLPPCIIMFKDRFNTNLDV